MGLAVSEWRISRAEARNEKGAGYQPLADLESQETI
jgi:hypothetical protein